MITRTFIKKLMTFGIILGLAIIMFIVGYVGFQTHWTIGMLVVGACLILICLIALALLQTKKL